MLDCTLKLSDTAKPAHVLPPRTHTVIATNPHHEGRQHKRKGRCNDGQQRKSEQARLTSEAAKPETGRHSPQELEQQLEKVEQELKRIQQELKEIRDTSFKTNPSTTYNTAQAQPLTDTATSPASSLTQPQTQIVHVNNAQPHCVNIGLARLPPELLEQILLYCVVPPGQGTDAVDITVEGVVFLFVSACRVNKTWRQKIKNSSKLRQSMFLEQRNSPTKTVLNPFISRITKIALKGGQRGNYASASWKDMLVAHVSTPYMCLEGRGLAGMGGSFKLHYMCFKSDVRMSSLVKCVEEPIFEISTQEATEEDAYTHIVRPYPSNPESKGDAISYQIVNWKG